MRLLGTITGKRYAQKKWTQFTFLIKKDIRKHFPDELKLKVYKEGDTFIFTNKELPKEDSNSNLNNFLGEK